MVHEGDAVSFACVLAGVLRGLMSRATPLPLQCKSVFKVLELISQAIFSFQRLQTNFTVDSCFYDIGYHKPKLLQGSEKNKQNKTKTAEETTCFGNIILILILCCGFVFEDNSQGEALQKLVVAAPYYND